MHAFRVPMTYAVVDLTGARDSMGFLWLRLTFKSAPEVNLSLPLYGCHKQGRVRAFRSVPFECHGHPSLVIFIFFLMLDVEVA